MIETQIKDLIAQGFTKFALGELSELVSLQRGLLDLSFRFTGGAFKDLSRLHERLPLEKLNDLRLEAIGAINRDKEFRAALFGKAIPLLEKCLGPDLVAQKNIALVISVPGDQTSQIPLHADTWTGHSLFELNLWVPLTEVGRTQSMFILPRDKWLLRKKEWEQGTETLGALTKKWRADFEFIEMKPGEALLFWHHLPHGNIVNEEDSTRWSLNVRFKNLFSPYGEKGLGDYFVPLKYGPVTELALGDTNQWR